MSTRPEAIARLIDLAVQHDVLHDALCCVDAIDRKYDDDGRRTKHIAELAENIDSGIRPRVSAI